LIAKDRLGNVSSIQLDLNNYQSQNNKYLLASNDAILHGITQLPGITPPQNDDKPFITIKDPKQSTNIFHGYENEFFLQIEIRANGGTINLIEIDEKPVKPFFKQNGKPVEPFFSEQENLTFDHEIFIGEMKNNSEKKITIKASNSNRQSKEETVTIVKKKYPALLKKNYLKLKIKNFNIYNETIEKVNVPNEFLPIRLKQFLINKDRFNIIESEDQAEYKISGIIIDDKKRRTEITCTLEYIGPHSQRFQRNLNAFVYERKRVKRFTECAKILAFKICRGFIRVQGKIEKIDGDLISTNIPYESLGFQRLLAIYNVKNYHNYSDAYVDQAVETSQTVQAKLSKSNNNIIRKNFRVITK